MIPSKSEQAMRIEGVAECLRAINKKQGNKNKFKAKK